jgi:3D-(3,5/4)-trihydroxycyclohexane-1,2-dione acylhydrolase (decyclizing)
VSGAYASAIARWKAAWEAETDRIYALRYGPPLSQGEVIGAIERSLSPQDVIVCAAGSLPGDLHKLWRTRRSMGYHMEYGYSCMGYEVAGGLGVKMADPSRGVYVLVGDASFLMLSSELVTSIQEGYKLNIVIFDNHGFGSIGNLSESLGSEGFGTDYRYRNPETVQLDGGYLPVDFVKLAEGMGAQAIRAKTLEDVEHALDELKSHISTTVLVVEVDKHVSVGGYESWWDVPVAEVSQSESVRRARADYEAAVPKERRHEMALPELSYKVD